MKRFVDYYVEAVTKKSGGGGPTVKVQDNKSVTYVSKGYYTVKPNTGYDALKQVSITVTPNILPTKTITASGTYDASAEGYEGYGQVVVNAGGGSPQFTDLSYFYNNGARLNDIEPQNLDTSACTNMSYMFQDCQDLDHLDLGGWDTSNVESVSDMFYGCYNLMSINLTGWDTNSMYDMSSMFNGCYALSEVFIYDNQLRSDGRLKFALSDPYVFDNLRGNYGRIHLSRALQNTYQRATNWSNYRDVMVFDLP